MSESMGAPRSGKEPAMNLRAVLQSVPDVRGKQGQDYRLWSILALIVVSMLCGRRGCMAAFRLGRSLNERQRRALGFTKGRTPCHGTLTETLRVIEGEALARVLGAAFFAESADGRHIAIDGKTMRATKNQKGDATHVVSAFCADLASILDNEVSDGKGFEIPDAMKLLDRLDLKEKIVTGDAMFCQKSIAAKIADKGGGFVFPVKDNQKTLRDNIQTAFDEPVFPPRDH
jgi:DDE_Tnp_1-associated/Transposase DDE domain